MTFKPLFEPITKLSLYLVTFRVSRFHVSHLTHETFNLHLQNTLNMSKTTRVYFGVLQSMDQENCLFSCHMSTYYWLIGFPYPLIPLLWDFYQMASCHVSTHGPHLSSCLTNSTHDKWHLLSHSKCVKCLAPPSLPRKT